MDVLFGMIEYSFKPKFFTKYVFVLCSILFYSIHWKIEYSNMDEERHNNQNSSDLKNLAIALLESRKPFYKKLFNSPIKAQFFSLGILIILTLIYLLLVLSTNSDPCEKLCNEDKSIYERGISVDPQTLEFSYFEHEINKELTPDRIKEIKETLTKKFEGQKKSLIDSRFVNSKAS